MVLCLLYNGVGLLPQRHLYRYRQKNGKPGRHPTVARPQQAGEYADYTEVSIRHLQEVHARTHQG